MRILIIGGTGFIGPHVVMRLTEMEHDITLFHRGPTKADRPSTVNHTRGDRPKLPDFAA
ncbi:NAD-dependent epimerase/dehydratase family protein, partial [candidate division TA06 bacterium]